MKISAAINEPLLGHKTSELSLIGPTTFICTAVSENNSHSAITFSLDEEIENKLQYFIAEQDTTLFATLLATFGVLLYRYNYENGIALRMVNDSLVHYIPFG